MPNSQIKMNK